ncbi:MAG: CopG family transcriptional regulator [Actinomycetota bacterium]|nr:CopG family transcriptional regulator [Actinomycetota bacterium]
MVHPVSLRFRSHDVAERLKDEAAARDRSASALAEELIDEGLRIRRHPLITFRDGPTGRRAALVGGPDVWEVVAGLVGGDVSAGDRVQRAVEVFGLRREQVDAVLAYYAEFTDEIDDQAEANLVAADQAEALWRRQHDLLAR